MKFYLVWIVWILACISAVLCQDDSGTEDAANSSILLEASKIRNFEATTSQKPALTVREEQIEDELANSATTTEKIMEKRMFITKPIRENNEYREIFTVRFDESSPTTVRSSQSSTKRNKASFSSSFKKYEDPEGVTGGDEIGFTTTTLDGLVKKSPVNNGERKTRQRSDGLKGVTTNRGKTRFQNESGTSEVPEISTTPRHIKPIRVKPIEQMLRDEVITSTVDDVIDTTTAIMDNNSETEQQRPKFKKPPLIATHHPNFGTSTESSRRPPIRANLNLKQKITSSTIKTRPTETDVTESENVSSNRSIEIVTSSIQFNKLRPVKVNATKSSVAQQQPIPPTATAWALASLKAPNNTNRVIRKPLNVTSVQEQVSKIKPFVTWSTRLQKTNEDNTNSNSISNGTSSPEPTELSTKYTSTESVNTANPLTPEITSTESLIHILSTLSADHVPSRNDLTISGTVGGDTDQNKYEVYGSQKPEVENTTTVIETLRPSSSTIPSESQNLNLLLVTSYKSIFENNNVSDVSQNVFTSSENPVSESAPKKEVSIDEYKTTTDASVVQNSAETPITENAGEHKVSATQTSTEIYTRTPGSLFEDLIDRDTNKISSTTIRTQPDSSLDTTSLFSRDVDLDNKNHSITTEHYIDDMKTMLDDKITKTTDDHDALDMVDFTHLFSSERPVFSSTEEADFRLSSVSEKTTLDMPVPSNEISSNTSQAPVWSNSPADTSAMDLDATNSSDSHDEVTDNVSKPFESSSESSMAVNEPTSESEITENDVPIVMTSTSTSTSSTTTSTTSTTTTTSTTQRPTTTTTFRPTITTTTTTTPRPTITTTTTTTQRPMTTITPKPSRRKTTTPEPIIIETTTSTTTTTARPKTSTPMSTTTQTNRQPITSTVKPNSITSRPKPAVVVTVTPVAEPNEPIIAHSFLKVVFNSTMKDVCQSEDELKDAIIKLFESGTERVNKKNQIRFLNVNGNDCLDPNDKATPVGVELYMVNSDGVYDSDINEEFINLHDHYQFDYKSNVIDIKTMKRILENEGKENDGSDSPKVMTAFYLIGVAGLSSVLLLILVIVRKRQKRFNYGQRCTPVSLDDYSMDNISVYNSVRRKGAARMSKRSFGNPAFDDSV